jgi:hypothetical protein
MKLRDLTRGSGKAAVWPAHWVEWAEPERESVVPDDGVLEGLTRLGSRLLLRINVNGQLRTASLEWDAPPAVGDVEVVLLASIGTRMRELGELELPTRTGRRTPNPRG